MTDKILFVNACVRPDSRTSELAHCLLKVLNGNTTELNLYEENISPLDYDGLMERSKTEKSRNADSADFKYAVQFADSDTVVIAAPYWDLSFPAVLKIYLEAIAVAGITFRYSESGTPVSLCRVKKLYYITTSGGYIADRNYGFEYVRALANDFYNIGDIKFYSAEGLDIYGNDVDAIMENAKKIILKSQNDSDLS